MDILVPKDNNNDEVVMISKLNIPNGNFVEKGADLMEFETSKTAVVLQAPISGYVSYAFLEGDEVAVNSVVCSIDEQRPMESYDELVDSKITRSKVIEQENLILSKKARQLDFNNTNLDGKFWVTSRMINDSGEKKILKDHSSSLSNDALSEHDLPKISFKVKKTSMRKRSEIASLRVVGGGLFQSTIGCDINTGTRSIPSILFNNSIQDLVCYELSKMLENDFSDLNAFYISDNEIGYFNEVAAGISLDDKNKLTVARISQSNKKLLSEIQDEMSAIYIKFEDGILTTELEASSFTITDLSPTSANYMLPLLNGAEGLIVGIVKRNDNKFGIYATFDHRVSEGLRVAVLIDRLKARIESHFYLTNKNSSIVCQFCMRTLEEELKLGNRGMVTLMTSNGLINSCRNCFEGL